MDLADCPTNDAFDSPRGSPPFSEPTSRGPGSVRGLPASSSIATTGRDPVLDRQKRAGWDLSGTRHRADQPAKRPFRIVWRRGKVAFPRQRLNRFDFFAARRRRRNSRNNDPRLRLRRSGPRCPTSPFGVGTPTTGTFPWSWERQAGANVLTLRDRENKPRRLSARPPREETASVDRSGPHVPVCGADPPGVAGRRWLRLLRPRDGSGSKASGTSPACVRTSTGRTGAGNPTTGALGRQSLASGSVRSARS